MVSGNWLNNDNLYIKYGTSLADPEVAGEFASPAGNRVIELLVDISKLSTTALILSDTEFFPSGTGIFIEKVEAVCETAIATITSFSIGLIQNDRATIPANYSTAFINAEVAATFADAGDSVTYNEDTTHAGGLIGSSPASATGPYYITGLIAGSAGTGSMRIRIYYHGIGTIAY